MAPASATTRSSDVTKRRPSAWICVLNANAVAVSSSAAPNVGVTSFENAAESSAIVWSNARVRMAAGNEPATSQPVIGHDTLPRRACAAAPPALVIAAKSRSVPTATGADTPKPSVNNGVISEPPPTPVAPTMKPTSAPPRMKCGSIVRRSM